MSRRPIPVRVLAGTLCALGPLLGTGAVRAEDLPPAGIETAATKLNPTQLLTLGSSSPWRAQIGLAAPGTIKSGSGVKVGIADTGVNLAHPALKGRISGKYNAINGGSDVTDAVGHGTHVAGIIGAKMTTATASPMSGVAPDVHIYFAKVFPDSGSGSSTQVDAGINWLVNKAKVSIINLSLGSAGATPLTVMQDAVTKGKLVVAAAGNDGGANPNWPARYASQSWALGRIIAVGSVDSGNQISSFSNRAGDAAQFYVVAPGEQIASTYPTGYAQMSGTSMATPIVTGVAAVIKSSWTYLTADKIAQVIFRTATDLGAAGVDPIYGWGLVNVTRALSPVGSVGISLDAKKKLVISELAVSSAPAASGTTGGAAQLVTYGFDTLGRHFEVPVGRALVPSTPLSLETVLGPGDRLMSVSQATVAPGVTFTGLVDAPRWTLGPAIDPTHNAPSTLRAMMLTWRSGGPDDTATEGAAGTGGLGSWAFGLAATGLGSRLSGTETALASPLFPLAGEHGFAAFGRSLGEGWSMRAGALASTSAFEPRKGNVGQLELVRQGAGWAWTMGWGVLAQPTVLGADQSALGLNQASQTQALSLAGAGALTDRLALAGSVHWARTGALQSAGLLEGASTMQSMALGVGAVWTGVRERDDRLGFTLSTPLRATAGTLRYTVVDSVDMETGEGRLGSRTVSARPAGWEKLAELRYTRFVMRDAQLSVSMAARFQPDHDPLARTQTLLGMRYLKPI